MRGGAERMSRVDSGSRRSGNGCELETARCIPPLEDVDTRGRGGTVRGMGDGGGAPECSPWGPVPALATALGFGSSRAKRHTRRARVAS